MAIRNYQIRLLSGVILGLILPIFSGTVLAEDSISNWHDDPLQLNVKFQRQTSAFSTNSYSSGWGANWMSELDNMPSSNPNTKYSLDPKVLRQYDATFSYPFQRGKFNFDLGLNIKFINGLTEKTDQSGTVSSQSFNTTLPMMYATALYELPWQGVSAGFEGKHAVLDSSTAYDYKAMLSYQSNNGFGLNGGWQYQLLHLNAFSNGASADSESEGPFVDVFYNF